MFDGVGKVRSDWIQQQQSFRVIAPTEMQETTGQRFGDTLQGEPLIGYRSGFLRDFEVAYDFDLNDKDRLYTADRPDSECIQNMSAAWARKRDDIIIDALQDFTYGGLKPYNTVQTPLPTAMQIPVTFDQIANGASNTNFTVWKIQEALARMQEQNVDLDRETVIIAIHPRVQQAWLRYAMSAPNAPFAMEFINWYNNAKEHRRFMGCRIVVSNRLKRTGSIYTCLIFTQRALITSPAKFDLRIDLRPDKRHMTQIVAYCKWGAMRMWDELVYLVYSDNSVAITY